MMTALVILAVWLAVAIPCALLVGRCIGFGAGDRAIGARSRALQAIHASPTRPAMGPQP